MAIFGFSQMPVCKRRIWILTFFACFFPSSLVRGQSFIEPPLPFAGPFNPLMAENNTTGTAPIPISQFTNSSAFNPSFAPQRFYPVYPYPGMPNFTPFDPYWGRGSNPFPAIGPLNPQTSQFQTQMVPKEFVLNQPAPLATGNFRMSVNESFLNRFITRTEQKPGEVRDFILGAEVSGHQNTITHLQFDLHPDAEKMRGALVLRGTTQAQTTGVTPQAVVDVASLQNFVAVKDLFFDGISFSTRHATVHVQSNNQTLGATTPLSGTLIGGIADRIAFRQAEKRRPAAEAIARDRVADRVFPEFDGEIDRQLAKINDQLEETVRRKLREINLMPSSQQVSSSDTCFNYSAQVGDEVVTSPAAQRLNNDDPVHASIHESLLNTLISKSPLKSMKTTDQEIKAFFAPYEYIPTSQEPQKSKTTIPLPGMNNVVTNIEFDDNDPLTIHLADGLSEITLRASFKPAGQDLVPPLAVTISYETKLIGNQIVIIPGNVRVALQSTNDIGSTPEIALKLIQQGVEANLLSLAFDRTLPKNLWTLSGPPPQISGVSSLNGWATISIR